MKPEVRSTVISITKNVLLGHEVYTKNLSSKISVRPIPDLYDTKAVYININDMAFEVDDIKETIDYLQQLITLME